MVRVNYSWEVEEHAQDKVDDDGGAVTLHEVNCEGWTHEAEQVGQQVDVVDGEVVKDTERACEEAEAKVNPELLVALPVQEDAEAGHHHSEARLNAGHVIINYLGMREI